MSERLAKRVLLIGWDAADWKIITPLLDAGLMPSLESLVNGGVMGNLATLQPTLSPMLWTSIATGKRADKHGVLGFTEPDPAAGGIRPSRSTSRKVKAIWNILSQQGMNSNVVGWFASHPAEPIRGVFVSEMFHRAVEGDAPVPKDAVHPERLVETLSALRLDPHELDARHILPFVPNAAKVDQQTDKRLFFLARSIAECSTVHAAATWLMENEPWDLMAVYYDTIDHLCHAFMDFHPPKMDTASDEDYELYKDVIVGAYRFHDMLLDRLLQLAGPETTVILCSDHGYHSDHLRPKAVPREPAGPAICHRQFGVVCMKGPHIKRDERIYGASLLDITPTLLTLFGLPVGADMDGRPMLSAFEEQIVPDRIPSWESVAGDCGMHPADRREDPFEAQEAIKQLVALGYIDPPDENQEKNVARTVRESKFNLARVHLDARELTKAAELLEELSQDCPNEVRFTIPLAQCYFRLNKLADCRRVVEGLIAAHKNLPRVDLLMGSLLLAEERTEEAIEHLLRAEETDPRMPTLHCQIGNAYLRMKQWRDAERAFRKAVDIDGDSAVAHDGLATALLGRRRLEEAAEESLIAVGLLHHFPEAHYRLGVALAGMGWTDRAVQALETCLDMRPNFPAAQELLARIRQKTTGKPY